ncbi:HAD family acid phosphatase [Flavobacteriaceae bacterium]|nr:HAD family acid phosphatase [Flavobacteriaceae bacterium]
MEYHLKNRKIKKGDSVMFDIDDTLIDASTDNIIPWSLQLLNYAKKLGYKIILITARPYSIVNHKATLQQLKRHKIKFDILLYASHDKKTNVKKKLIKDGFHFVLSVGDLWTDLTDSDHWVKLPEFIVSTASHNSGMI